LQKRLVK